MAPSPRRRISTNVANGFTPEGNRIPRMRDIKPASLSMFESTIDQNSWKLPAIGNLENIEASLKRDHRKLNEMYNGVEPKDACGGAARFNIKLPESPQHLKYCHPKTLLPATASESSSPRSTSKDVIGTKFSLPHLEHVFKHLSEGSDIITHRKFIVALQTSEDLLASFRRFANLPHTHGQKNQNTRASLEQNTRASLEGVKDGVCQPSYREDVSIQPRSAVHKQELGRMKRILVDLDEDGSGQMEWDEFVEFFRRAGLLMEYQTRRSLNHTELDDLIVIEKERQRKENKRLEELRAQPRKNLAGSHEVMGDLKKTVLQMEDSMGIEVEEA